MHTDPHVLHVRSSAGLYGAEYVILGLVPALAGLGIGSTVLSLDNPHLREQLFYEKAKALGLPAERVPCRGRFDFAAVQALRRAIANHADVVLHVHDYKSALYAWFARGSRRVPIVATAHGQFSFTPSLALYHRVELRLMRRFDRVCTVAADMRPALERAGVPRANICLIENGIDTARFAPDVTPLARADFGIGDDAVVFGAAMRLTEQKNPPGLVAAFAQVAERLPQAVLVVAGEGALRDAMLARATELGVAPRVRLVGNVAEAARFYTMLDVFVLPSLYEGLPLALLEAMAAQCRIVATRVGQIPQVLADLGVELVRPGEDAAFAQAMIAAAAERSSTEELRRRVVERYSVARMAGEYAQVYDEARSRHGRLAA